LHVMVRDNNVEQALRVLKRKLQREGVFREMKRRRFYEKPSDPTLTPSKIKPFDIR
jgi:small subunit ribosomal protein S21